MDMNAEDARDADPMAYDALRELEARVRACYLSWADEARTHREEQHWLDAVLRLSREVRAVDSRSRSAVEAKRAELRELLAAMPLRAPALA
jgi:hypothetical protein